MRLIDVDTIQWTANGCGHPNCKDICDYTKDDGTCCGWLVAHKRDVDNLPTVDAVPVVHAHWIRCESTGEVKCSACNDLAGVTSEHTYNELVSNLHYCSNCGAIMDGKHGN